MKISADIKYIQTCKTERLTSTFPKVNMPLKNTNFKHLQIEKCYFNYRNWNAKQALKKTTKVEIGIKRDTQYTGKKFAVGYFECSFSSSNLN